MKISKRRNKIAMKKNNIKQMQEVLKLEPATRSMGPEAFSLAVERNLIRLNIINEISR